MFVAGKSLGKRHIAKILDKGALSARMHITRARIGRPFLSHFMDICMAVCVSIIMILFFFWSRSKMGPDDYFSVTLPHVITTAWRIEYSTTQGIAKQQRNATSCPMRLTY
jgi:hypothetical protein